MSSGVLSDSYASIVAGIINEPNSTIVNIDSVISTANITTSHNRIHVGGLIGIVSSG